MARIIDTANQLTSPEWLADAIEPFMLVPAGGRVDISQFYAQDSVLVTVGAIANQNATSITVSALSGAIPSGTVLYFGGAKVATLTAAAAAGATTLTVAALPTALAVADSARYAGVKTRAIPSGTVLGRTQAELEAGTGYGPFAHNDDEIYIVPFENHDIDKSPDVALLRPGALIYENFLPDWSTLNVAADEVQTVALAGTLSGGQFKVGAVLSDGSFKWSEDIAYNANLAAIQAGYDTVFGASKVVIAGTVASHTVTFSGAGYTGVEQSQILVDANEVTGITSVTITETTKGGKAKLAKLRSLFRCQRGVA